MATFSASQPISTITPPHSSDGRTSWDYAVPLDGENSMVTGSKPSSASRQASGNTRQPLSQQRNGPSKRTNTMESSRTTKSSHSADSGHATTLTRKASNLSAAGDAGYGDVYRADGRVHAPEQKRKAPIAEADYDDSNWIHRDKLAQIESRELEEAGFRVPRNAMSRGTSSRSSSRHQHAESVNGDEYGGQYSTPQDKRQRTMSPARVEEEDAEHLNMAFELRTPEEVAAERELEREMMSKQNTRPGQVGNSKIPVKKSSPLPVPSTFIERDSPLTRSRTGSNGWTGSQDGNDTPLSRSISGQAFADDVPPRTPPASYSLEQSPVQRSPPKARVPSKATPTSNDKKSNKQAGNQKRDASGTKPRAASGNSPTKRPGTSSGRPSTSHNRPEGDPPWIATMYKPDPLLPPDQQILPTHAKRMAQEQWAKEGTTGTVYDRDFRLLNDEQIPLPQRKSSLSHRLASKENLLEDSAKDEELPSWPLAPPANIRSSTATSNGRPGTSGTDHGGYSIMPNLNSKHASGSPNPAVPSPRPIEVMRMYDPEAQQAPEDEKKKKSGCACCVVM